MRSLAVTLAASLLAVPLLAQKSPPPTGAPAAPTRTSPRTRGADPWVGTFVGNELQITLQRQGQMYTGTATAQGARYPLQGYVQGNQMSGQYVDGGVAYPFQAQLDGATMQLAAGGQLYVMQRRGTGAPGDRGTGMGGAAAPGGATGGTAQDRQLAQLLMRSAWCSFSYVSAGGSSGSGRSSTERIVFQQGGSGFRQTGGESYYSGSAGSVAGQSSGGEPFRWRTQNGMLVVSDQSGQESTIQLRVTQNSNGYPIITANGTEYSMCN